MNTQLNKLLDDGEAVDLALDIDVDTDGRFPDPANHYAGKFVCMTVYLSNKREYITYGIHDITSDTREFDCRQMRKVRSLQGRERNGATGALAD